ncbi:retrotransposon protein, putative, ty1-copia subclass [Tanacetum coccineum]
MAATAQNTNNTTIRSDGKLAHLEQHLIPLLLPDAPQAVRDTYEVLNDAKNEVACLMLGSLYPDLQRVPENYKAYDMIQELKTMFEEQAKQELFETVKAFHACKQEEGQSVSSCLLKMKSYLDTLERLGYAMPNELGILKKAETPAVLAIWEGMIQKDKRKLRGAKGKDKGKNKIAYALKPKILPPPKRDNLAKDSICHHCKEVGHWRRNCPSYQAELKKRKEANMASTLARILNMVPTKKVERTPYEIWHEKAPKLSARIPQAPDRYGFYVDVDEYELGDLNEPPNYKAALSDPEYDKWLEAMNTEMQSMKDNQVWILDELPPNGQTVGSKWLFKKKTDMDGNVHTFKARIRVIRILLAIDAFYDYEIWKMDIKTAFLNGHLSEDVYMVQLEGFVDPKHPNKVCKLQHFIYGLKQASRSWNKRFDEEIKKIGFTQNPDEPCVYLKASGSSVAFLVLYVDDILLMGNNITMLQDVKYWICKCFSMKDLREAAYILGIKIIRDISKRLIGLCQSAYLEKILKKFSKKRYTPMMEKLNYRKSQGAKTPSEVQRMQRVPYASAIVVFSKILTGKDDTKSQTGYVFVLNGGAIDWKSAKKITTAMSSIEAEYIAAAKTSMEAV